MCVFKLRKTHPVPAPTLNLHDQDSSIHTFMDIQISVSSSESHQNQVAGTCTSSRAFLPLIFINKTKHKHDLFLAKCPSHLPKLEFLCSSSVGGEFFIQTPQSEKINSLQSNSYIDFQKTSQAESVQVGVQREQLFPSLKLSFNNFCKLCAVQKTFEGVLAGPHSGPPGNHGNEDQERTLSCRRPEPGFGGGGEQTGGGRVAAPKCTPKLYKPYSGRQNTQRGTKNNKKYF